MFTRGFGPVLREELFSFSTCVDVWAAHCVLFVYAILCFSRYTVLKSNTSGTVHANTLRGNVCVREQKWVVAGLILAVQLWVLNYQFTSHLLWAPPCDSLLLLWLIHSLWVLGLCFVSCAHFWWRSTHLFRVNSKCDHMGKFLMVLMWVPLKGATLVFYSQQCTT